MFAIVVLVLVVALGVTLAPIVLPMLGWGLVVAIVTLPLLVVGGVVWGLAEAMWEKLLSVHKTRRQN